LAWWCSRKNPEVVVAFGSPWCGLQSGCRNPPGRNTNDVNLFVVGVCINGRTSAVIQDVLGGLPGSNRHVAETQHAAIRPATGW
jgi:hypothetical protein